MENYASNSNKKKEAEKERQLPEKKVEAIVSGKKSRKNGMQKFVDDFVHEDVPDIGSYIVSDILVPAFKRLVMETVETILYPGGNKDRKKRRPSDYVSYRSYSEVRRRDRRPTDRTTDGYSFDNVMLDTRGDAEAVLSQLEDIIDMYDFASVGDLYDLVGITPHHTDNKYGWDDISGANIVRDRDGMYIIRMPRVRPL